MLSSTSGPFGGTSTPEVHPVASNPFGGSGGSTSAGFGSTPSSGLSTFTTTAGGTHTFGTAPAPYTSHPSVGGASSSVGSNAVAANPFSNQAASVVATPGVANGIGGFNGTNQVNGLNGANFAHPHPVGGKPFSATNGSENNPFGASLNAVPGMNNAGFTVGQTTSNRGPGARRRARKAGGRGRR